jgi:alpha-amylase
MRASVTAAAALALSGLASAANITEWKSRSIYQVMIDRFALTDGSTTEECVVHQFCGGTWKGLMNKLDYIQGKHLLIPSSSSASAFGPVMRRFR